MKRRIALKHIGAGLSAGAILPWITSCKEDEIKPEISYKGTVAVIGAGAAGLYAADFLLAKGINVVVLEASDRLGGRVRSLRPFDKTGPGLWFNENAKISGEFPVELGADRIYGSDSIWSKFINQQKLPTMELGDFSSDMFWLENTLLSYQNALSTADFETAFAFYNSLSAQNNFSATVQDVISSQGISPNLFPILNGLIGNKYGTSNSRVNIGSIAENLSLLQRNNSQLLLANNPLSDALIEGFIKASEKTQLNTIVKEINYQGEKVMITGEKVTSAGSEPFTLEVDKVIVTVPISVLKAGDISFNPELPAEKLGTFSKISMDNTIRVALDFRKNFWEAGFRSIYGGVEGPEYFNTGEGRSTVARTLTITISGPKAEEFSPLGNDVIPILLEELDAIYNGEASANIRHDALEDKFIAAVQDWGKEPFIKGGISYLLPGGNNTHRQALAAPIGGKMFFAGEATDYSGDAGTVNGALVSGERAALELIATLS